MNFTNMKDGLNVVADDIQYWIKDGKLHNENGPAVKFPDGYTEYRLNGKRHREDGPAIICSNGTKYWYQNSKLHRTDGPAVEYSDGSKMYYINDLYYSAEKFKMKSV